MTNTKTASDMFYFHECLSGVIKNAILYTSRTPIH